MECLYHADLNDTQNDYSLQGDEVKHARALRLREGDEVLLSNGRGLAARAEVRSFHRDHLACTAREFLPAFGEQRQAHTLAIGILQSRERFEFALEKAVELGVAAVVPLLTEFSQRARLRPDRLEHKMLAAMKQCKRSVLPTLFPAVPLADYLADCQHNTLVLCDAEGESRLQNMSNPAVLLVGPEGGFSAAELELIRADRRTVLLGLGPRRLRAETAALTALGILNAAGG